MTDREDIKDEVQSIAKIDRVIHEPARLMIMAVLYELENSDFTFLKRQTGLTRGNLSSHLSKLEEEDYVEICKEFVGKVPRTLLALTSTGRDAFEKYRGDLFRALGSLRSSDKETD